MSLIRNLLLTMLLYLMKFAKAYKSINLALDWSLCLYIVETHWILSMMQGGIEELCE